MLLFRALTNRSYALLWGGQVISRLGDSVYQVALAWWVLQETGSSAAVGLIFTFSMLPMVIFLLVGGAAVDRFSRRDVMLVSDVMRAALMLGVAALDASGQLQVWHVYGVSLLFGLVSAFFQPAYHAVIPDLLPSELLPSANSLTSLSAQLSSVIGPAIGAYLLQWADTAWVFGLNGGSFVAAALTLIVLRSEALTRPARASRGIWHEVQTGLRFVFGTAWIWITIAVFSLVNVFNAGPLRATLPKLVDVRFPGDVGALGLLYSAAAAGSVVAALALGNLHKLRWRGPLAYGATLLMGLMIAALGLPLPYWGLVVALAVYGIAQEVFGLVWINTLQELVPREMLGRVNSVDMLGSFVFLPLGFGGVGWLTDQIGPMPMFLACGLISAALALLALCHPAIHRLD
jgi:DHA3 family tetracycline resistance protein-like MFS transporter